MNTRLAAMTLATLGGTAAMMLPSTSFAGNVGHYFNCAGQGTAAMANAITTAGHTPVDVIVPDAATLAGLDVLWVNHNYKDGFGCSNAAADAEWLAHQAAVTTAIQNGLVLIVFDRVTAESAYGTVASVYVPGASGVSFVTSYTSNVDIPAGSPLLGQGIDNSTLDGGNSSAHGYGTAVSLPAGATIWANDGTSDHAVMFSYGIGSGTVIYSSVPMDFYMDSSNNFSNVLAPGTVAAAAGLAGPATTCASEGYTGTQLTWCRNICEMGYTGSTLSTWIRRWTDRYRQLPYCAVAPQPVPAAR
ncbi:MAG: hypothetical protein EOP93_04085 [Lysobacteraceae bacterium]|nr:MAG: hypothetical protein EOP93_04085 [Xanthomonadaceae bacterium]